MSRRLFLVATFWVLSAVVLAENPKTVVRGKLTRGPGSRPALQTADQKLVFLDGDEQTAAVLKDPRLAGADFEVLGKLNAAGVFAIDPIHTKAMFVHKNGKRFLITYWCAVCSIRTYSPGKCQCCQGETDLDLQVFEDK